MVYHPHYSRCDFVVKYDPDKDTSEDLTERILYTIYIKRLKAHKPAITFIGGDSGEGKTLSVIRFQEILCKIQNLDVMKNIEVMNIFTPLEYPEKMNKILYDKEYKKVNIIAIHEARDIVKAKMWQGFLAQSVADVNAMSRAVKRIATFIISQFIRDITTDIRYTLNYYCIIRRPKQGRARLYFYILWKDDRDLEKPKLRKRKLSGYLVYPNGVYKRYKPEYFEMKLPNKEIRKIIEEADYRAKVPIIKNKLSKMIDELKIDIGQQNTKITQMVNFYLTHDDSRNLIGKIRRGKWRLKTEAREMHGLAKEEAIIFENDMDLALRKKGLITQEEHPVEEVLPDAKA